MSLLVSKILIYDEIERVKFSKYNPHENRTVSYVFRVSHSTATDKVFLSMIVRITFLSDKTVTYLQTVTTLRILIRENLAYLSILLNMFNP